MDKHDSNDSSKPNKFQESNENKDSQSEFLNLQTKEISKKEESLHPQVSGTTGTFGNINDHQKLDGCENWGVEG